MEIISRNYGCYFDEFSRKYPPEFHHHTGYAESHINVADEVSEGVLNEICFQGVRIHYGDFRTRQTDTISTTEDFGSIDMTFQLQGHTDHDSSAPVRLAPFQHNLTYRPYANMRSRMSIGSHQYVGIQLTETFVSRLIDDNSPSCAKLLNHISQRKATILSNRNLVITPALQIQLSELIAPNRPIPLKRLYLELTVLDLFRQQIDQADASQRNGISSLSPRDVEKIMAVKTLLDTDPLGPYTLRQLCRSVGLNDFKLKKGFREVLSTTVFRYLTDLRMAYARQLLRDTDCTVNEVASRLGYSETHHFSSAFKRKFGYLPSQVDAEP
ncbi:helix-turn-helix transcriptional regulator [Spirosoma aerolatum]|uniref:helix-turn-helix transcriptional regulator n=1 Tax=Spirosoma aerolatum TaxID=1211326 RepID=UPI0009AD4AEE|nr:helix-turn-helix transcriptional regulator [Spirosoma aerolatum]